MKPWLTALPRCLLIAACAMDSGARPRAVRSQHFITRNETSRRPRQWSQAAGWRAVAAPARPPLPLPGRGGGGDCVHSVLLHPCTQDQDPRPATTMLQSVVRHHPSPGLRTLVCVWGGGGGQTLLSPPPPPPSTRQGYSIEQFYFL